MCVCNFVVSNFLSSIIFNRQMAPRYVHTVTNVILANRTAAPWIERNITDI